MEEQQKCKEIIFKNNGNSLLKCKRGIYYYRQICLTMKIISGFIFIVLVDVLVLFWMLRILCLFVSFWIITVLMYLIVVSNNNNINNELKNHKLAPTPTPTPHPHPHNIPLHPSSTLPFNLSPNNLQTAKTTSNKMISVMIKYLPT